MAKNLSRKYATMSDDERRRFALEEDESSTELPAELSFEEPRKEENMGQQFSSIREEVADPEHRDGISALLDDAQHERAVREGSQEDSAGDEQPD